MLGTGASKLDQVHGHAGLRTLAAQVAKALSAGGRSRVAVRFDDSAFAGPTLSPSWSASDVQYGFVGHVTALGLDADLAGSNHPGPADPSLSAGQAFAEALRRQGITVVGDVVRTRATAGAKVLGEVRSAPVADVLGVALTSSNNTIAEVLARLTAQAMERPATFEDSALAVMDQVQRLGVDVGGSHLTDGSGLAAGSAVTSQVLADLLVLASGGSTPALRPLLAGLPVSGFTGTLAEPLRPAADRGRGGHRSRQDRHADRRQQPGRHDRRRGWSAARLRRHERPGAGRRHDSGSPSVGQGGGGADRLRLPITRRQERMPG